MKLLPIDTLLVAMYGQGQTRGRTGLLAVKATTNQACFAILPNYDKFEPRFLQFWFRANYHRLRQSSEGRGGNQPNLNGDILRSEEIPLPSLEVQRQIVNQLNGQLAASEKLVKSMQAQKLSEKCQAANFFTIKRIMVT